MERLNALRNKHIQISEMQIVDLMKQKLEYLTQSGAVHNKQINESQAQIEELKSQISSIKENLHSEIVQLEQKNVELAKYRDQVDPLEVEKKKLSEEVHALNLKRNNLKSAKPNLRDEQILDTGKKKLKLYREFTGIKWNYWDLKESIAGYVSNRNDYIKHFSYKNEKTRQLTECVWEEIFTATKDCRGISNRESCKENISNNQ